LDPEMEQACSSAKISGIDIMVAIRSILILRLDRIPKLIVGMHNCNACRSLCLDGRNSVKNNFSRHRHHSSLNGCCGWSIRLLTREILRPRIADSWVVKPCESNTILYVKNAHY
jgi:putative AlgH/UPF0301 family transcriptional regulator